MPDDMPDAMPDFGALGPGRRFRFVVRLHPEAGPQFRRPHRIIDLGWISADFGLEFDRFRA